MSDADLIYNALLRAERRVEAAAGYSRAQLDGTYTPTEATAVWRALEVIREEIGNGLAEQAKAMA